MENTEKSFFIRVYLCPSVANLLHSSEVLRNSLLATAALLFLSTDAVADDWPLERGDSLSSGVASSAIGDEPNVLWKYEIEDGGFEATAVVVDGIIYVGDNEGTLHAIRLRDGTAVWKKSIEESGFVSAAAIHDGHIIVGDYDGVLRSFAVADGAVQWTVELAAEVYGGPIIYHDTVLVTNESGSLDCLAIADGKQRWQYSIDAPLRCAPTVADGQVLLAGCDGKLHIVNAETGRLTTTIEIDGPTGSTPAARDNTAYFGTEQGTFYAIELPSAGTTKPAIRWTYHDPDRRQGIRSAAAVDEHVVVFGSQGKAAYALNPETGKLQWKFPVRSRVVSSPVIAGGRVVLSTFRGRIYLIDVQSGEATWEYNAGGSFVASPAVVDSRLVLGNTDGTLYCFGHR